MQDDGYQIFSIRFTGWKALVAGIVVMAFLAAFIFNLRDRPVDEQKIIESIITCIKMRYLRLLTEDAVQHIDSGDVKVAETVGLQIAGMQVDIDSVKAAYPVVSIFFNNKDIVAKVVYTISISGIVRESRTAYFEMHHLPLNDSWLCDGEVDKIYYYLNMNDDD